MAKQSSLFKTIATIIATSALTLSVAVGAVVGRALNKQNQNSQIPGQDGQGQTLKSIDKVEKTNTYGLIDEYTIYYTDGSTSIFIVTNGSDGQPGAQGFPGSDGVTPTISIENGNWIINGTDTGVAAVGPQGPQGPQGPAGQNGLTPYIGPNGHWWIGETDTGVQARGMDGEDGYIPLIGENGNWWIGGTDTGVPAQGQSGRGIQSIEKTDSQGLIDVYTITYTDGTTSTFFVTNGADGSAQGQGIPGQDGHTPVITIGENGNWFVDGVDTGTHAQGPQGQNGQDGVTPHIGDNGNWWIGETDTGVPAQGFVGTSVLVGNGQPDDNNGNVGDKYIDLDTGDLYEKTDAGWGTPTGNSGIATPHIGDNGNWYIGSQDTGVKAQGADGVTPHIGANGNWWVGQTDLGVPAQGAQGPVGPSGTSYSLGTGAPTSTTANQGDTYIDMSTGDLYKMTENGWEKQSENSGFAIPHIGTDGYWYVGENNTGVLAQGPAGQNGNTVLTGNTAPDNENGVDGDTYIDLVLYNIYVKENGEWVQKGCLKGAAGRGIASIERTDGDGTPGTVDTYTITYTDGTTGTFMVANGSNGAQGVPGEDGHTPTVEISNDGYWVIDGTKTTVLAQGTQGNSVLVGNGAPNAGEGIVGDTYINLQTGDVYTKTETGWGEPTGDSGFASLSIVGGFWYIGDENTGVYAQGFSVLAGNTVPDANEGHIGDTYIDASTGNLYLKTSTGWGDPIGNLKGANGRSIVSIALTSTSGLEDTYTITYSDNTTSTFTVVNGEDGTSLLTGSDNPVAAIGKDGDSYINTQSWEYFAKENGVWESQGTIKGADGADGTSFKVGYGNPNLANTDNPTTTADETRDDPVTGIDGDSFLNLAEGDGQWDVYVYDGTTWTWVGNIHNIPTTFQISFDNGTSAENPETQEVQAGYGVTEPIDPTNGDYFFQGWFTPEGHRWDFEKDTPTKDMTLTARWATFEVTDGILTGCIETGAVVIPSFFDGQVVTGIDPDVFKNNTSITSITIPYTIQNIPDGAFEGCTALTEVYMPEGLQTIGENAFKGCTSMQSVVVPNSVKTIGNNAFEGCTQLKYVYLSNTQTRVNSLTNNSRAPQQGLSIGSQAFKNCSSLLAFVIPNNIESIGFGAFEGCSGLKSLSMPSMTYNNGLLYGHGAPAEDLGDIWDWYLDLDTNNMYSKIEDSSWELLPPMIFGYTFYGTGAPDVGLGDEDDSYLDYETGTAYIKESTGWEIEEFISVKPTSNLGYLFASDDPSTIPSSLETINITGGDCIYAMMFTTISSIKTVHLADSIRYIETSAFAGCTSLQTINLPDGLERIDKQAFYNCPSLSSITIPASVSVIGDQAFNYCSSLSNLEIKDGVSKTIGWLAFADCTSLTTVSIPGCVSLIDEGAFGDCTGLTSVYFLEGNGQTSIGLFAFNGCTNIETLVLSNCVVRIGNDAFEGNKIQSVVIPDSVTYIGERAFSNCSNLAAVYFGSGLEELGWSAFSDTALTNVVLPESLMYIGTEVFAGCDNMVSITMPYAHLRKRSGNEEEQYFSTLFGGYVDVPATLKTVVITGDNIIPEDAFNGCSNIETLVIQNNPSIAQGALAGLTGLESLTINTFAFGATNNASAYTYYAYGHGEPNTVNPNCYVYLDLDEWYFYTYEGGSWVLAVDDHGDLEEFHDAKDSDMFAFIDGAPEASNPNNYYAVIDSTTTQIYAWDEDHWETTGMLLQRVPGVDLSLVDSSGGQSGSGATYSLGYLFGAGDYLDQGNYVPASLESLTVTGGNSNCVIPANALSNCVNLKYVTLGENVTAIGDYALANCSGLSTINLPNGLLTIGDRAFDGCTNVESLIIPDSVTHIGFGALHGMTSLSALIVPFTGTGKGSTDYTQMIALFLPDIAASVEGHHYPNSLKTIVISQPFGDAIPVAAFAYCEYLENISIPNGYKEIGGQAFGGTAIKSFVVPEGVTSIGLGAFASCSNLEYITLPNSLREIGANAFYNDSALESIVIPGSVETIGEMAFQKSGLVSVVVQDGTYTQVDYYAFKECENLKYVSIQGNVNLMSSISTIGGHFSHCEALEYVYLGFNVPSIPRDAFSGCTALKSVTLSDGLTYIGNQAFYQCSSLTNIVLPESLTTIDEYAFQEAGLTKLVLPGNVTALGYQSFRDCTSLESVVMQAGAPIDIGGNVFARDTALKTVVIECRVDHFDDIAPFYGCRGIEYVSLGEGNTEVKDEMFANCINLKTVVLPNTITSIGKLAFYNTGLTSIVLPDSVKRIDERAFGLCASLTYVYMPEGLEAICDGAFYYCNGWYKVLEDDFSTGNGAPLQSSTTGIYYLDLDTNTMYVKSGDGHWDPDNTHNYVTNANEPGLNPTVDTVNVGDYYYHNDSAHNISVLYINMGKGLQTIVVPDSVQDIGRMAFAYDSNLESLTIPFIGGTVNSINTVILTGELDYTEYHKEPSEELGNDNDLFFDTYVSGNTPHSALWRKVNGKWYKQFTFAVPNATEEIAANVQVGTTNPSGTAPEGTHYYINTQTGNFWVNNSGTWQASGSLLNEFSHLGYFFGDSGIGHFGQYNNELPVSLKNLTVTGNAAVSENALRNASHLEKVYFTGEPASFGKGSLEGCTSLNAFTVPYIGQTPTTNRYMSHFFGGTSYSQNATYVPTTLETLTITGDYNPYWYAAQNIASLKHVAILGKQTVVGDVFKGCTAIESMVLYQLNGSLYRYFQSNMPFRSRDLQIPHSLKKVVLLNGSGENEDEIYSNAFLCCFYLETIIIPDNIKIINNGAFQHCVCLKNINIPEGLTAIGTYAFENCLNLESFVMPDTVTSLGYSVFATTISVDAHQDYIPADLVDLNSNLKYVKLSNSLTTIPMSLFSSNNGLLNVTMGSNVTTFENYIFQNCTSLQSISIPDSVTSIGARCFDRCRSLSSVHLPSSLTFLGESAFYYCESLVSINLQNTKLQKFDGNYTFGYCYSLQSVVLPNTMTTITDYSFVNCSSLIYVYIPYNVKTIGRSAFEYCYSLQFIDLNQVETIESYAFGRCKSLRSFTYAGAQGSGYYNSVLTRIENSAFSTCVNLESVVIPDSVTYIGQYLFSDCASLKSLTIPFVGQTIDSPSDLYYLSLPGYKGSLESLTITKATSIVSEFANGFRQLKVVSINSYECAEIGNKAFSYCSNLEIVNIASSNAMLGDAVFYECKKLKAINLPGNITSIGEECFYNCNSLESIVIPNKVERINDKAFYYCTNLEKVTMNNKVTYIGREAFYYCGLLKSIDLPKTLTEIGNQAFYYCTSLESIVIPSTVREIGYSAFYNCTSLAYAVINDGVERIGSSAFGYTGLKSVVVPNSVYEMDFSFSSCKNLESVTIPFVGTTAVNPYYDYEKQFTGAFDYCTNIKTVVVTGDYTIHSKAFQDCYYIETIAITGNPSSIGSQVFDGCKALSTIILPYMGASAEYPGGIVADSEHPNGLIWLSTPIGNIHLADVPNVIIPEKEYSAYWELNEDIQSGALEGKILVYVSAGQVKIVLKDTENYSTNIDYYSGESPLANVEVRGGNWFVGDTDTGIAGPADFDWWYGVYGGSYEEDSNTYYYPGNLNYIMDDDEPCYAFIDVNTFDIYFVDYHGNLDPANKANWEYVHYGNLIKNSVTGTVICYEAHDPEWWGNNIDTLAVGTILVSLSFMEVGEVAVDSDTGHNTINPYNGDILNAPHVNSTWYIDDVDTGVTGYYFDQFVYGHGTPTSNNVTPDHTRVYVDYDTLDVYFVANADADYNELVWSSTPNGNLKKSTITVPVVAKEAYDPYDWDDYDFKNSLADGTIIVTLDDGTLEEAVRQYYFYEEDYDGDVGFEFPYIGANGNWWLGDRDSGYYAYSSYYDIGNDVMSSDPNYAGLGYLDIDTYDFYVSIDTIAEGTIFFNTTDGSVERYIDGNWVLEDSIAGSNYTSDTVDPHDADGDDNDWYINTSSGDIFKKQSGSWEVYHNIYNFFTRLNYHFYKFGRNEVHVPKTLKNVIILGDYDINDGAFEGCRYLETVTIKGNVKHIGNRAFKDCLSLQINLPDSLVTIGDSAFENCGKLQSVVLGPNVTSIGKNAFANCNGWTIGQLRSGQSAPRYIQSIRQGDMYIDLSTGNLYFYLEQGWELGKSYGSYTTTNDLSGYDTRYYSEGYLLFVGPDYPGAKKTLYININSTWVNTGLEVYYYYGAPSSGNDYDGCKWYFDGNNNEMYILNNDEWVMGGIRHLTSGQGAPSAAGNAGDYYADVTNDVLYYYDGSSWGIALRNVQMYFAYGTADDNTKAPEDGTLYKDTNTNAYYIFSNNKWNLANGVDIIVASGSVVDPFVNNVEAEIGTYLVANDGASTLYKKISNGLSSISIGKNVTSIGEGAFRNNRALESVVVPNNVESIGLGAFQGCNSLKTISIPFVGGGLADPDTQYIGYMFGATYSSYNDEFVPSSLKTIIISSSVTSIGEYAFDHCSSLKEVVLPNGLESIGNYAFQYCTSLTSFDIPDTVKSIGDAALQGCTSLTYARLPNNSDFTSVAGCLFYDCENLKSISIPASVTEIGLSAFARCASLTTIEIPTSVNLIENNVLQDCNSLETISIPFTGRDWKTYYDRHFGYLFGAPNYTDQNTYIPASLHTVIISRGNGSSDSDPIRGIIGVGAFSGCSNIKNVILRTGFIQISESAFEGCAGLTSVAIPDSVTTIDDYAFLECTSLKTIALPSSLISIGESAYDKCTSVESINFEDAPNLKNIGDYAFASCWNLKYVNLWTNNDLVSIGEGAFVECVSLASVWLPENCQVDTLNYTFGECVNLTRFEVPEYVTTLIGTFQLCSGLSCVYLSTSLVEIGEYTFAGCSSLTSISLPYTLTTIGYDAFGLCTGLTQIVIPDSVQTIERTAFEGCYSLRSITVPFVGGSANGTDDQFFSYIFGAENFGVYDKVPSSLREVIITGGNGDDKDTIPYLAFNNCSYIENIVINEGVKNISVDAFSGCSNLKTIELPSTLESIGMYAFSTCKKLTTIYYAGSVEDWNTKVNIANYNYLKGVVVRCGNGTITLN